MSKSLLAYFWLSSLSRYTCAIVAVSPAFQNSSPSSNVQNVVTLSCIGLANSPRAITVSNGLGVRQLSWPSRFLRALNVAARLIISTRPMVRYLCYGRPQVPESANNVWPLSCGIHAANAFFLHATWALVV